MIEYIDVANFKVLDGRYNLHRNTVISGPTGAGKTSIGEAILWLFLGRDPTGNQTTLHFFKDPKQTMRVKARLADGTEIERRQVPSGGKTVRVNDTPVSEADLEAMLTVPWRLFASIFWVGFFEELSEADRRALIMSVTPEFDRQAVFEEMLAASGTKADQIAVDWSKPSKLRYETYHRMRMEHQKLLQQQQGVLQERRMRLQQHESELAEPEPYESKTEQLRADLEAARTRTERWNQWDAKREAAANFGAWVDQIRERNRQSAAERERLQQSLQSWTVPDGLQRQLETFQEERRRKQEALTGNASELNALEREKAAIKPPIDLDQLEECPSCGQKLTDKVVRAHQAENRNRAKQHEELAKRIQEKRAQVDVDQQELRKLEQAIARLNSDIEGRRTLHGTEQVKIQALLDALKDEPIPEAPEVGPEPEPAVPTHTIQAMKHQLAASEEMDRQHSLKVQMWDLQKTAIDVMRKAIVEAEAECAKLTANATLYEAVADALHPVKGVDSVILARKIKAIEDLIQPVKGMKPKFVMSETLQNGDVKDCFRVYWNDKPRELLSSGEKILVSVAVAALLDDLTGNALGMHWIDDAGLVSSAPPWPVDREKCEQLIVARTERGSFNVISIEQFES